MAAGRNAVHEDGEGALRYLPEPRGFFGAERQGVRASASFSFDRSRHFTRRKIAGRRTGVLSEAEYASTPALNGHDEQKR
jgi:hypothetical protein